MSVPDGGPAFPCAWCDLPASHKQGRIHLCPKHYRFQSMRTRAAHGIRDGDRIDWLEARMATDLLMADLATALANQRHETDVTIEDYDDVCKERDALRATLRHA